MLLSAFIKEIIDQIEREGLSHNMGPALLKEIFDIDHHMLNYLAGGGPPSYKPMSRFDKFWEENL